MLQEYFKKHRVFYGGSFTNICRRKQSQTRKKTQKTKKQQQQKRIKGRRVFTP